MEEFIAMTGLTGEQADALRGLAEDLGLELNEQSISTQ